MNNNHIKVRYGSHKDNLQNIIRELEDECNSLLEDRDDLIEELRSWNRDVEIQKLEEQIRWYRAHSLQMLSDKEKESIQEFIESHFHSCNNGSTYQYELAGTGIGTVIKIRCPICQQEKNITDYSTW